MKPNILSFLVALACISSLRAQTVSGNQLEIGSAGSDQVTSYTTLGGQVIPATNSGAIGTTNTVHYSNSFAVGTGNHVHAGGSMSIGGSNYVGWWFPWGGTASLGVGFSNWVHADGSLVVGLSNTLDGSNYDWAGSEYSFLTGRYNYSAGKATFIAGENNYISGDSDNGHTYAAAAIGQGLISNWSTSLIIGKYNDSTIPQLSGLLFAIGNGNGTIRSNALEVYADGKIKMPRQGDILMGSFGNAGD